VTGPTRQPELPVVQIQQTADGGSFSSIYQFNPLSSPKVLDFNVVSLTCKPPADRTGGKFEIKITSPSADNSTMNTILSNIIEGCQVKIYKGKTNAGKSLCFLGVIETIEIEEPNKNLMFVTISGPDWGSDILKNRVINGSWIQRRLAGDPTQVDTADNSTKISQIISDMVSVSNRYLDLNGPTVAQQGIVYSSTYVVPSPDLQVSQFEANAEKIDDKLSALDDLSGSVHYVDPNKNLVVKPALMASASGVLITDDVNDSVASTWDQTKLAYIAPGSKYKRTLENHKSKLLGLGGDATTLDQSKTTTTNSTNLDSNYVAMQFIPVFNQCAQIDVYCGWVGTPTSNLVLILVEDNAGLPTGSVIRTIQKAPSDVPSGGNWISFPINETLNIAKKYWIVLAKTGSAANTFKWYRDALDTGVSATSADGVTYTLTSTPNRFNYSYREYYSTSLISIYPPAVSATSKHLHEEVYRYAYIHQQAILTNYLTAIAAPLTQRKDMITCLIYAPDVLLSIGQSVRIRKQSSGYVIDGNYTIGDIEYIFQADDSGTTGTFWYQIQATTFTPYTY